MGELWVSFGKICDFTGKSMTAVRNAAARGDLGKALSTDGRKVNPAHPDAVRWMGKKYTHTAGGVGRRVKSPAEQAEEALNPIEEQPRINEVAGEAEIQKVTDAIIILTEMGSPKQIHAWARVRKEVAQASAAEAKRDQATGQLVPRAMVERAVFGYLDAMNRRALEDLAPTIATRIGKGTSAERKTVEDLIGSLIQKAQEDCRRLIGGELE